MLHLGILPEGYIYQKEERMIRDLLRKRFQLVRQKTINLLSMQGLYARHLKMKLNSDQVKRLTERQLTIDFSDLNVRLAVRSNIVMWQVVVCLTKQVQQIERVLKQQLKLKEEFVKLTSIDGIGLILALTIMLETGEISRFNKVGQYSSYCRCVNGGRYSNSKKSKKNTKNGNKYLAWTFIEAANFAIRFNNTVKRYYRRKLAKKSIVIARNTVAHKLARACYYVMCSGTMNIPTNLS